MRLERGLEPVPDSFHLPCPFCFSVINSLNLATISIAPTITNNVVFGAKGPRTAAVYLSDAEIAAGSIILNGNYLDGGGVGIAINPTVSAALVQRINNGVNSILGKTRNNILMGGIS